MKTVEQLSNILASQAVLYSKTQNFHWNVQGKHFISVHKFTEGLYETLAAQIDETAERIRALGSPAPGTLKKFLELSFIQESEIEVKDTDIISTLLADFETLTNKMKETITTAEESNDPVTADMLTGMAAEYEKNIWMMKSYLN